MLSRPLLALGCAAALFVPHGSARAEMIPVARAEIPAGAQYVALGSSYASGPGLPDVVDPPCQRSAQNYPHQVAAAARLQLVDVSCGGATTADILDRPQRIRKRTLRPPQIDAVTADTQLITVSIGGNDLDLIGSMMTESACAATARSVPGLCENLTGKKTPTQADVDTVEHAIADVVRAVHTRAPHATVLLVQYLPALDRATTTCATAPMRPEQAAAARHTYNQLLTATVEAAEQTGAQVIAVPGAESHTACSADPWISGLVQPVTSGPGALSKPDALRKVAGSYHPNLAGTTQIAKRIIARIGG
jgi:hypothetical protein